MQNETSASGRAMTAVCTLPLLSYDESFQLFSTQMESVVFTNETGEEIPKELCIQQFGDICGGHPRSILSIVNASKALGISHNFSFIIQHAARLLVDAMKIDNVNILEIVNAALLGESVHTSDIIGGLSYTELVTRGIFIDSRKCNSPNIEVIPKCQNCFFMHGLKINCPSNVQVP